jgi:hypothetical protein
MAVIFNEILEKGLAAGKLPGLTSTARDWYRDQAKKVGKVNETIMFRTTEREKFKNKFLLGHCYLFYYDPKHKDTLPYYDRVPLVFPIAKAKGGFLGINLHYLPLRLRAKLMDSLYTTINNEKFDETTKLKATYSILSSAAKFKEFKPTIKHYLLDHVRSRFMHVSATEWDIALFLGVAKFQGATQAQVWNESVQKIKGTK